jgi:hypothetical protein
MKRGNSAKLNSGGGAIHLHASYHQNAMPTFVSFSNMPDFVAAATVYLPQLYLPQDVEQLSWD